MVQYLRLILLLGICIWGEVEQEKSWTWDEFNQLPRITLTMDIHCVTKWSKLDTTWEGVSVRMLVERDLVRLKPSAKYVLQHAEYGFTVNLPLEVVWSIISCWRHNTMVSLSLQTMDLPFAWRGWLYTRTRRPDDTVFLERCQVATRTGIPGIRSTGFLGAGWLSQRS